MKIIAITQVRFGSVRLPGKVLRKIGSSSLLDIHLKRSLKSKMINDLIVATTLEPEATEIEKIAIAHGVTVYKGSLTDVLDRFYQAALPFRPDYVVRITADCPLIDSELMDNIIVKAIDGAYDYCSNATNPTFPDGVDVEVMSFSALERAWKESSLLSDREHVTPYICDNLNRKDGAGFTGFSFENEKNYSGYRITVDDEKDFEVIKVLVTNLGDDKSWLDYVNYLEANPLVSALNNSTQRNEGYVKSVKK